MIQSDVICVVRRDATASRGCGITGDVRIDARTEEKSWKILLEDPGNGLTVGYLEEFLVILAHMYVR